MIFELVINTFEGAINPGTLNFSDPPQWLDDHFTDFEDKSVERGLTPRQTARNAKNLIKGYSSQYVVTRWRDN